jgi:hypothetical protein
MFSTGMTLSGIHSRPGFDILDGHFRDGPTQRVSGLHDRLHGLRIARQEAFEN